MTELSALWLPILLSSVAVFIVSSIIHMATPLHKNDYRSLPDEGKVAAALRPFAIPPGDYMVPRCTSMEEMRSPQFLEKMKQGPVMIVTVMPNGAPAIGRNLALWFVYSVVIGVFAAYIAGRALSHGADYLRVFQFISVTAFLGYSGALWQFSIWYRRSWSATMIATIDGLIYALVTAGMFGWLWPR